MFVPHLLLTLVVAAPPEPSKAAIASQRKLAAECVRVPLEFPAASVQRFETAEAAFERYALAPDAGVWEVPGALRRTKDALFFLSGKEAIVLRDFDKLEPADRVDESTRWEFAELEVADDYVTLRMRRADLAEEDVADDRLNALIDRRTGSILGAHRFTSLGGPAAARAGRIAVEGDRVIFFDDDAEDMSIPAPLALLRRCALHRDDAPARAAAHLELARAAAKRAPKAKVPREEWREAWRHYNTGLAILFSDQNLRIERAAVALALAEFDPRFVVAVSQELDTAERFADQLTEASKAEVRRLRARIVALTSQAK